MSCACAGGRVNRNIRLWQRKSALVGAFARGDLLDQFDDATAHFGVGDARERACQRQAFGSREKVGYVGRRAAFAEAFRIDRAARAAVEQKRYRYL
jgi:hypothetical protein